MVGRFKHMFRNNVLNYEYAIREHKGNIIIDGEITGRPMGFVSSNLVKWLGIFLIVLVFMPLFNYSGTSEPIWAYLVNINWESGLNLSRFSTNRMEIGVSVAIFQSIIGSLLIIAGELWSRSIKMELGLL